MKKRRVLFITEDFPSGLNGTSVKTRNTLKFMLNEGYTVDLFCFHFEEYSKHDLRHPHLKIYKFRSSRYNKRSLKYFFRILSLVLSFAPISLKRLYLPTLYKELLNCLKKNTYTKIFFDGYSTLQYNKNLNAIEKIYIDDEDFTDLFRQRFLAERSTIQKIFYASEFIKSLIFERIQLSKIDQVWAISSITAKRLKRVSGKKTVVMPTYIPSQKIALDCDSYKIIFTGSLDWKENADGLKWFINNHWETIIRNIPTAKLVVIGQGASQALQQFLGAKKAIVYKGYVKNLIDEYSKAGLAIAPVRINAGIKVKILTYLSYGMPVVSTQKASLGLVSTDGLLVSSESSFAQSILFLLRHNKVRSYLSKKGHKNIKNNYSRNVLRTFLGAQIK